MPRIVLETEIHAPIEICFDLSRSIDLHQISTSGTNEEAIDGRMSGLVELNDFVTWRATHFGIRQKLSSKITALERPYYFKDEQLKGAFRSFHHEHRFEQRGEKVVMTDIFEYRSPMGIMGGLFNQLVLTRYLKKFLMERNAIIKEYAETDKWKSILQVQAS